MPAKVELDLFSGRPNPTWELTHVESDEILRLLSSLPETTGDRAPEEGLGYRGIVLTPPPDAAFTEVVVAGGVALATDANGRIHHLLDRDRALERRLLETGRGRIAADIIDAVARELA